MSIVEGAVALDDDVLVVTGGSRGIGAAIVRRAASWGYAICLTYSRDAEAAEVLVREITAQGVRCIAVRGQVEDSDFAPLLFAEARERLGPVTALVNNAGITGRISAFAHVTTETMREVLAVNLLGPMLLGRHAVTEWLGDRIPGRMVNISSVAATLGAPGEYIPYAATKAGIEAFTLGLAKEVASSGIRINSVAPGAIQTNIHAAGGEPRVVPRVPMGRIGEPEEIANAVVWLLSEEASYVTGATLRVSGGV